MQADLIACLFDLILYVPSTIFQLNRAGSSWVEPVLSLDKCVLLKDHNAVTLVRLKPAASRSRAKHSTTDPLRSLRLIWDFAGLTYHIGGNHMLHLIFITSTGTWIIVRWLKTYSSKLKKIKGWKIGKFYLDYIPVVQTCIFIYFFYCLEALCPSQQFFSHAGMISCLPG